MNTSKHGDVLHHAAGQVERQKGQKLRVGLIGSGNIATLQVPLILNQPDTEIVGIADCDLSRARGLASRLSGVRTYASATEMLDAVQPDVIHVLTPPEYHASLAKTAMHSGCHVLVEKPMALSLEDAREMIAAAHENDVRLCVGTNLVAQESVRRAKALALKGAIGEIVSVEVYFGYDTRRCPGLLEEGAEYSHWAYRLRGGLLQDLMPHPASLLMEFLGEIREVRFVEGDRGLLAEGWSDEIRLLVKSDSILGYASVTLNEKPDGVGLVIRGTEGLVRTDLYSGILVLLRRNMSLPRAVARGLAGLQLTWQHMKGWAKTVAQYAVGRGDKTEGRAALIAGFYNSVRGNQESPISLDNSLRVVELMSRIWPEPLVSRSQGRGTVARVSRSDACRVLVTGASGFLGTHLTRKLLASDVAVRALVRPNSPRVGRLKKLGVEIVEGDIGDGESIRHATRDAQIVVHGAFPMGTKSWEEVERFALWGTKELIDAAITNGVHRIVFVSSLTVYDILANGKSPVTEECPFRTDREQMGPYAWGKIETEKLLLQALKDGRPEVTIVRPGIVIGPLGPIFYPQFGYRFRDKLFVVVGQGDTVLPLTYVENTVDGIYKACTVERAAGEAYNIVDDGSILSRRMVEECVRASRNSACLVTIPYAIPYLAAAAYELCAMFGLVNKGKTSRSQMRWKQTHVRFDNSKAKRELEWEPRISLEEGLSRTFLWQTQKGRMRQLLEHPITTKDKSKHRHER